MNETVQSPEIEVVELHHLMWAGPLAVAAAVGAVLIVRLVAVVLLNPPTSFSPLGVVAPVAFTTVLVTIAIVIFVIVACVADRPLRVYRRIALGVLMVSFLPLVRVAHASVPGAGWAAASALAVMHIVAWAVTMVVLERLTNVHRHAPAEIE